MRSRETTARTVSRPLERGSAVKHGGARANPIASNSCEGEVHDHQQTDTAPRRVAEIEKGSSVPLPPGALHRFNGPGAVRGECRSKTYLSASPHRSRVKLTNRKGPGQLGCSPARAQAPPLEERVRGEYSLKPACSGCQRGGISTPQINASTGSTDPANPWRALKSQHVYPGLPLTPTARGRCAQASCTSRLSSAQRGTNFEPGVPVHLRRSVSSNSPDEPWSLETGASLGTRNLMVHW